MNNKLFASMAAGLVMCLSTPLASAEPDSGTAPPPDPSAATQGASPAGTDLTIGRPSSDSSAADSSSAGTSQAPTSKVGSEPTDGVDSSGGAQTSTEVLRAQEDALSRDTTKLESLFPLISDADQQVKDKLAEIEAKGDSVSIADMFALQTLMNHLSQMSEMSSAVVSAANTATQSMARGVKG